jgi:hypothetical protein
MKMLFYRVHDGCRAVWANLQEFRAFKADPNAVVGFDAPITIVMVPEHLAPEMRSLSLEAVQLVRPQAEIERMAEEEAEDEYEEVIGRGPGATAERPAPAGKKRGRLTRSRRPVKGARRKAS